MDWIGDTFGHGRHLDILQMSLRAIVVFFIALLLIRVSGRRSFGIRSPLDNIIVILLGAVLSRAVIGISPFLPVVVSSFVIVILHRVFGWLLIHVPWFHQLVQGDKILLYKDGRFIHSNMRKALICKEDIFQALRKTLQSEDLEDVARIYMETSGQISLIRHNTKE